MILKLSRPTVCHLYRRKMGHSSVIKEFRKKLINLKENPNPEGEDLKIKKTRITYSLNHYQAINNYLDSKPYLKEMKDKIPLHFMVRTFRSHNSLYIIDKEVACQIFEEILPHLQSHKGHILEVNAGFGVLTKYLLSANLPKLRIYEGDVPLHKQLHAQILTHHNNTKIFNANLLMLPSMSVQDKLRDENRVQSLFQDISPLSWGDDPVMCFIIAIPNESFLLHVMYAILLQNGICEYGRPEFFFIIPATTKIKLLSSPASSLSLYRYLAVLFQIIFETTVLCTVPDEAFVPWLRKIERKVKSPYQPDKMDEDKMFLVRAVARKDLYQQIPPHLLKPLWCFVRKMMFKRKASLMSSMEEMIPGYGVRLIARGFTVYTTCGSLTPQEYVDVFKEFFSHPEFKDSSFESIMNRFFSKLSYPGNEEEFVKDSIKRDKQHSDNVIEEEDHDVDEIDHSCSRKT